MLLQLDLMMILKKASLIVSMTFKMFRLIYESFLATTRNLLLKQQNNSESQKMKQMLLPEKNSEKN